MTPPRATYRLQLHDAFTLADATHIVAYLARLGISHLYLSPITQATAGSAHGYDVTDPTRIAMVLGGEPALRALTRELRAHDMGMLLDIVPNHMAASSENPWWADLLENGRASRHAKTFDTPLHDGGTDRLRLPVLGASLGVVVERGELKLAEHAGRTVLQYHDRWFPLPDAVAPIIEEVRRGEAPLESLVSELDYELHDWRTVGETVCYRRFFDITDLVGVRVEDPSVFAHTHAGIMSWIESGWVDGLRIDHIDGLRDPADYLRRLAQATAQATGGGSRCYTVVEKILAPDEGLPEDWECDGATGYEFTRVVSAFLVDPAGYVRLDALRRDLTGERRQLQDFVHDCKRYVLESLFNAELADVAARVSRLSGAPAAAVHDALRELTAALDVYRTYISQEGVAAEDRRRILEARAITLRHLRPEQAEVLEAVCDTLLLDSTHASEAERARVLDAVARWQQLSGPVMAKGFEDTALYAWPALLALNEVGGEPGQSLDADGMHAFFAERARSTAGALNATSTHDTKRSEDVRARLLVLSELAQEWEQSMRRWQPMLRSTDSAIASRDEIVLMQTLVGAWPLDGDIDAGFAERIRAFMRKAAREAKQETSWTRPDARYEAALDRVIDHALLSPGLEPLRRELQAIVDRIALHGAANSLSQTLLKCAAPGVPDVYQGTEGWRLDLVDPDNRRAVDFPALSRAAGELASLVAQPAVDPILALMREWRDGRIKQYVLMGALACRARSPAMRGGYAPLAVRGRHEASVLAFRRDAEDSAIIAIVSRWPARLAPPDQLPVGRVWADTHIETGTRDRTWRCALTGRRLPALNGRIHLADALAVLPVALLERL